MMNNIAVVLMLMIFVTVVGCAGMSETQQRTVTGGLIGAGAGAGVAAIAGGKAGVGAVVGGAAGALTGYFIGESHRHR